MVSIHKTRCAWHFSHTRRRPSWRCEATRHRSGLTVHLQVHPFFLMRSSFFSFKTRARFSHEVSNCRKGVSYTCIYPDPLTESVRPSTLDLPQVTGYFSVPTTNWQQLHCITRERIYLLWNAAVYKHTYWKLEFTYLEKSTNLDQSYDRFIIRTCVDKRGLYFHFTDPVHS